MNCHRDFYSVNNDLIGSHEQLFDYETLIFQRIVKDRNTWWAEGYSSQFEQV